MTVRMQFIVTDDLDEHEKGEFTEIGDDGETIVFSIDGHVREVHLTPGHAEEFRGVMHRYVVAGHEPGQEPLPPGAPVTRDAPSRAKYKIRGQGRRRELPGTRDFYRGLREWARADGREVPTAGRQDNKKNYVYDKLLGPYLAWLEREAKDGRDGGVAAAQLAIAKTLGLVTGAPAGT